MAAVDLAIDVNLGINSLVVPYGKPRGRVSVLLLLRQLMRVRTPGARRGVRQRQLRIRHLKRVGNAHFMSVPQSGKSRSRGWEVGRGLITSRISRAVTGHTSCAANIRFDWCSTAKAFIFFCKKNQKCKCTYLQRNGNISSAIKTRRKKAICFRSVIILTIHFLT